MDIRIFSCVVFCLAAPLLGQSSAVVFPLQQNPTVVPPALRQSEGSGATNLPFGRSVPLRLQMAYDRTLFGWPLLIQQAAFRQDQGFSGQSKSVTLELSLSTMPGTIPHLQPQFHRNRGPDETKVFGPKVLSLPGPGQAPTKSSFSVRIPFEQSFRYDPAGGSLLLESVVHSQPAGSYSLDTPYVCNSPLVLYGPSGCGPKGGQVLRLEAMNPQALWGHPMVLRITEASPGGLTLLFLGDRAEGTWQGISLPFEASPIGAPGCYLSTSVIQAFRQLADSQGRALFPFVLPSLPQLKGIGSYLQGIAEVKTANPLGVVSSRAGMLKICGWEPVARVFANGLQASSGHRELGVAPVLELTSR